MGWDVVQIGLRHNLPVQDPFATEKRSCKKNEEECQARI